MQREKDRAAQKREEAAARRRARSEERSEERAALENSAGGGVGSNIESEVRQERAEGEEKDGGCSPGADVRVVSAVSAVDGGGDSEANGGVRSPLQPSPVAAIDVAVGQGLNLTARASCDGSGGGGCGGLGGDARTAAVVDGHHGAHLALVTPPSTASSAADSSSPDTNLTALPSPSPPETSLASLEPIRSAHSAGGGSGDGGGGVGGGGGGGGGAGGGGGGSHRQSPGSETDMEDRVIICADSSAVADGSDDTTAARLPSTALRDQRGTDLTMGSVSGGSLVRGSGVPVHGSGSGGCSRRREGEAPPEGTGVTVLGGACGVADIGSGGGDVGGVRLDGDGVDPDGETGVGAGEGLRDSHGERAEEEAERVDDDHLVIGGLSAMDVMLTQEQEEAETCTLMYGE